MPEPNAATVANSSALIALDMIGRLELLRELYGSVTMPSAVAAECSMTLPAWLGV